MTPNIFSILVILSNLYLVMGSNILVFMPAPFNSHISTYKPLFKELAQRGHNVTFYTATPYDQEIPNMKQIAVKFEYQSFFNSYKKNFATMNAWDHYSFLTNVGFYVCESLFQHQDIKELIHSEELKFDVLMIETLFAHEPFIALGHKFNAPIIHLHPYGDEVWLSNVLRNPHPLSYVPNLRLPASGRLTFYERVTNMALSAIQIGLFQFHYIPEQEKMMRKYFKYPGSENLPPLLNQLRNTSLAFIDADTVIGPVTPRLPNIIPVGGIHIANKPLPANLEAWINDSPNGVVFLSLGSMIKVSELEPAKLNVFLKVLGNLPQRILWKWEKDGDIPGQPSNVRTSKWFPQMDILAHPKCRAFITHGGLHSIIEAAYFGVPIVGTPVFADQEHNLVAAEKQGIAQMVKFSDFREELLSSALNKVINDPSFRKNAKLLSNLMRDTPQKPMETAIFWVEHVIRHKGVQHLTAVGIYLPWYEYHNVDIIGAGISIILSFLLISYKLFKFTVGKFCKNKTKKD